MNVLIAGANGFVGKMLIKKLTHQGHHITALVREKNKSLKNTDKIKWIEGDLLNFKSLPELGEIDKSFYLVHGLKASEREFEYEESLASVNFINWIRPTGSGIIYLGALGDNETALSPHLRSRHLTGAILGASGLATIEFRASIVIGEGSLSFEMIKAISERFPFRPKLSILEKPCQPLALEDLLEYLEAALDYSSEGHNIFEVGGPEVVTYGELIDTYSKLAGLRRKVIKVPEVEAKILMKALDYSIPEHSQMGKKLAGSLEYPTVVTNDSAQKAFPEVKLSHLKPAMDKARKASKTHYAPLWEKDFLKSILSDKILAQSGLIPPELISKFEKVGKLKAIFSKN